jgi:hypothetical protein
VVDEVLLLDALTLCPRVGSTSPRPTWRLARRVSDSGVLSFDRGLDRLEGVDRLDPGVVGT